MRRKNMAGTLYVTDLDKTLMRNDLTVSDYTVREMNRLIGEGVKITYATARSFTSAYDITKDIKFRVPVITRTGTTFADQIEGREIETAFFSEENIRELRGLLPIMDRCGFTSVYIDGKMFKVFQEGPKCPETQGYIDYYKSKDDKRLRMVGSADEQWEGDISYITLIASQDELAPYYEKVRTSDSWELIFQKDAYRDEYWLEICPKNATKAKAVLKLKERLNCDKVVVFGDSLNDLPMFEIADVSCAVSNAMDEVKKVSDVVIGSNEEDGVVKFILNDIGKV